VRQAQLIARRGLVALCAVLAAVAPSGVGHGTASAAWLHTDGRIVFVSDLDRVASDLYTMKPDGTDIRRITFDALPASPLQSLQYFDPAFSPDGTKIAAARDNAVTADLLVMNADGSNPVVIGPRGNSPSWSPRTSTCSARAALRS
jgi:Tol biopolymer transport system component